MFLVWEVLTMLISEMVCHFQVDHFFNHFRYVGGFVVVGHIETCSRLRTGANQLGALLPGVATHLQ